MSWRHVKERAHSIYVRQSARLFARRLLPVELETPIVSFTFDDFPRSALHAGGEILSHAGAVGTYYAAFGLMGRHEPTGKIFEPADLKVLLDQGHELGCHTFDHYDASTTAPAAFVASIVRNQRALANLLPGFSFRTHAYPIGAPRIGTKRRMRRFFESARGGGQQFCAPHADLDNLAAFFLEKCRGELEPVKSIVEGNRKACGWLVIATHDVAQAPTPYGCTPAFFESTVRMVRESGARILPVHQAIQTIRAESRN